MTRCRILSTKKLPQSFHSAVPAGVELIEKEFITIHPSPQTVIQEKISRLGGIKKPTLVFTSCHAVAAGLHFLHQQQLPSATVYCLSGATLEEVQKKIPGATISGIADTGHELAEKIIADSVAEVVFFCGNRRRDELPELLGKNGIQVHELVVYETHNNPLKVFEEFNCILFFSPSAVESFFMANKPDPNVTCIAIGGTTAASVREHATNELIICEHPSKKCMLAAIEDFISKQKINDIEK